MKWWNILKKWIVKRIVRHLNKERKTIKKLIDECTDYALNEAKNRLYEEVKIPEEFKPYMDQFIGFVNDELDEQAFRLIDHWINEFEKRYGGV